MNTTILCHQRMQQTNEPSLTQAEVADLLFAYTTLQGLLTLYATSPVSYVLPWITGGQHLQESLVLLRQALAEQRLDTGASSQQISGLLAALLQDVEQADLDPVLQRVEGGQLFLAALSQVRHAHLRLAPVPAPLQTEPAWTPAGEQDLFLDESPSWWDRCMQWQPKLLTGAQYLALSMLNVVSLVLALEHSLLPLLAAHALLLLCFVVFHQASKLVAHASSSRAPVLHRSMAHLLLQASLVLLLPCLIGLGTSTFAVVPLVPLIAIIWRLWQGEELQRPAPLYAVVQIIGTEEDPETEDCWGPLS